MAEAVENEVVENGGAQDVAATENNVAVSDEAETGTDGTGTDEMGTDGTGTDETGTEVSAAEAPQSSGPARDADGFTSALPSLADDEPRKHVPGGIGYEVIYVVKAGDPQLVETSTQRVRELIEGSEGAIDNIRASEVRRFAYPINKQNEGVYVVVNARFKPEFTSELERYFKIDESILRHMMLKEDR